MSRRRRSLTVLLEYKLTKLISFQSVVYRIRKNALSNNKRYSTNYWLSKTNILYG